MAATRAVFAPASPPQNGRVLPALGKKMQKTESRSWILLSIGQEKTALYRVISNADYINHAIPTFDEMLDALEWLLSAELIEISGQFVNLTSFGFDLVSKIKSFGHPCNAIEVMEQSLAEVHTGERRSVQLTKEEYEYHCNSHHDQFRKIYKKVTGNDLNA